MAQNLVLKLSLKNGYKFGIFVADLYSFFAFVDRKRVAENLKVIFPEKTAREIAVIRKKLFHNFAKYLVDFFRINTLDMEYVKKNIRVENMHYVDAALKEGNGAILATAHLGNWELGGVLIAMLGYPLLTVALSHKSKEVDEFFNGQRQSRGLRALPLGNAAKGCLKALRNNEVLALVGDREFAGKGIVIDFFGKPAVFPLGPAGLSLQTKAKIIPGFMLRNEDDSFVLVMNEPIQYEPSGDKEKDLKEIVTKYKNVFEDYIRRYPDQWYMFRRFWKR